MRTKTDEKILEILKETMTDTISHYNYSIQDWQEESTCINYVKNNWLVSHFEHGMDHPICGFDSCFDACKFFLLNALPGERWSAKRQEFAERVQQEELV